MRYAVRPSARIETPGIGYSWDGPLISALAVDGPTQVNTGLIDSHGNAIVRVQAPIGFGRDEEH